MTFFPDPLIGMVAPITRGRHLCDNIDTDTIIPSREMKTTGRSGLAEGLFAPWRYSDAETRTPAPEFALNQPEFANAKILAGGANFGCGSSREHAVWALAEYGIRAILAESFAPIFRNNCLNNAILPVALERAPLERVASHMAIISLAAQQVKCGDERYIFEIDLEAKTMLAEGLDAIDLTLTQRPTINAWIEADRQARPWVYLRGA